MKKSYAAKRTPRKIAGDDDDDGGSGAAEDSPQPKDRVVKRPSLGGRGSKRSSLRLSFGQAEESVNFPDSGSTFTPKKSLLSRVAIERNAERKSHVGSSDNNGIPIRAGSSHDRPSYSKDSLDELRSLTPSTPQDLDAFASSLELGDETVVSLDFATKLGLTNASGIQASSIPTPTEIREKKERRARLAKEENANFISVEESDDVMRPLSDDESRNEISLNVETKYPESRLVRDDEDIAEGFDDFVTDEKLTLGKSATRAVAKQRREEMASMIAAAEGVSSNDSNDADSSDEDRNAAYVIAQTKAGNYSTKLTSEGGAPPRPRTPTRITPIPDIKTVQARFHNMVISLEAELLAKRKKLEKFEEDKQDLAERGDWIQTQLRESGENFERMSAEAGISTTKSTNGTLQLARSSEFSATERGLENIGTPQS